ncbi:RNA polymerase sigma factor [Actinoplanes sp. M2I2]|uniref:RNA polymerase sigma factor n=1 Tax=Actinoplanes sp. M2I2 TaxID=1734444 RepID=UPI00201FB3E0|nr:sigma-70 family RNA polymerase sigma factor [Actinoplanes sp. M2I2]
MTEIERIFRAEYGRAVAVLIRHFGDIDVAEEAVQDAFVTAVLRWPRDGIPASPAGWIITTARNRALDRVRRERTRAERESEAARAQWDAAAAHADDDMAAARAGWDAAVARAERDAAARADGTSAAPAERGLAARAERDAAARAGEKAAVVRVEGALAARAEEDGAAAGAAGDAAVARAGGDAAATGAAGDAAVARVERDAAARAGWDAAGRVERPGAAEGGLESAVGGEEGGGVVDDRLRLIFTCCHPALAPAARVALTLRLLGGLTTVEIARAFLVPETTMGQRLSRAKGKIRDAGIPYRVPRDEELPDRLGAVLSVLYLIFNEGYAAGAGPALTRDDLANQAIRLARLLVALMPDEPEARGLLALMLLVEARRPARTTADGDAVSLSDQDRTLWNRALVTEGQALLRDCLRRGRPGTYQLQATINAVHADAATAAETDWPQILRIYDHLAALAGGPIVALHRAVAVAEVHGPAMALAIVDDLDGLERHHVWHVVRADLLRRLGRVAEAAEAYGKARDLAGNAAERAFLERRAAALPARPEGPPPGAR